MELLSEGFHYLWSFIVILSVIVFIHEFGHYLVARLCGVKVEMFSIGFGRELFGFNDRAGTRWKFSLLPFGGYVKMFGDAGAASTPDDENLEQMSPEEKRVSFHYKPLWQKTLVVAAGPLANFILTITILTYFLFSGGIRSTEPVIGTVMEDTPAQEAGLQAGDRIVSVDGTEVFSFGDISREILTNLGEPVQLHIDRDGETITRTLVPMEFAEKDTLGNDIKRPLIGIRSEEFTVEEVGLPAAVWHATKQTYELCETTLVFLGQMISGQRSAEELKGPVGIAQLSGQVTEAGETTGETLRIILWFIALLSANLGLVNLLPIPMLDGGHIAFYAIEAVQGKPLARQFQEVGFRIGLGLILCLMAFTLFNDIRNIVL